jgi:hypothetical protein
MMTYTGNLEKMKTTFNNTVSYHLPVGDEEISLNQYIGKNITLHFLHQINCTACGKKTNKSFGQGFCYSCFSSAPQASECILHPQKCQAHLGISRDMKWSLDHCLTPHIVYLANSSNLKVGITRKSQIPTRWIDQGATQAIIVAETPNRHIAGIIEKFLMQFYADKTNWQAMLKGTSNEVDLETEKIKVNSLLPQELVQYITEDKTITQISYPIEQYPSKINSLSFDKTDRVEGILTGIKGQYLFIDHSRVINIRKHRGYLVEVSL